MIFHFKKQNQKHFIILVLKLGEIDRLIEAIMVLILKVKDKLNFYL